METWTYKLDVLTHDAGDERFRPIAAFVHDDEKWSKWTFDTGSAQAADWCLAELQGGRTVMDLLLQPDAPLPLACGAQGWTLIVNAWTEDASWVGQVKEYDIASQAKTLDDLRYEMARMLAAYVKMADEQGMEVFEGIAPAPELPEWARREPSSCPPMTATPTARDVQRIRSTEGARNDSE